MIEIIKKASGEKANELREELIEVINEYKNIFSGYELVGIIDTLKRDVHHSIEDEEDTD